MAEEKEWSLLRQEPEAPYNNNNATSRESRNISSRGMKE